MHYKVLEHIPRDLSLSPMVILDALPRVLALTVLASNCKRFLPTELPHTQIVAFPGQIVVTYPDISSSHNEQLVASLTRLPKNVPPRM